MDSDKDQQNDTSACLITSTLHRILACASTSQSMIRTIYAFRELIKLRKSCSLSSSAIIQTLKTSKLFHVWWCRAGKCVARQIKVMKNPPNRKPNNPTANKQHCHLETPAARHNLPSVLLSNVTSLSKLNWRTLYSHNRHFFGHHGYHWRLVIPTWNYEVWQLQECP